MVSIKEATNRAISFAQEALGSERTVGVRLEEIESTAVDGEDAWLITLSMVLSDTLFSNNALANTLGTARREYKSFTVLKDNGEVKSMKIRELADR
jgi:hypothetical protein